MRLPVIVGIVGGIASGKNAFGRALQKHLHEKHKLTTYILNKEAKNDPNPITEEKVLDQVFECVNADVIMVNGLSLLENEKLRSSINFKIFLDAESDDRLAKFVKRLHGKENVEEIIQKYYEHVKPSSIRASKSKQHADFFAEENISAEKMEQLGSMLKDLCAKQSESQVSVY